MSGNKMRWSGMLVTAIVAMLVVVSLTGCDNPVEVGVDVGVSAVDVFDLDVQVLNGYGNSPLPGYGVEDWYQGTLLDQDVTDSRGFVLGLRTLKNINAVDIKIKGPRSGYGNDPYTWYFNRVSLDHAGRTFVARIDISDPTRAPWLTTPDGRLVAVAVRGQPAISE